MKAAHQARGRAVERVDIAGVCRGHHGADAPSGIEYLQVRVSRLTGRQLPDTRHQDNRLLLRKLIATRKYTILYTNQTLWEAMRLVDWQPLECCAEAKACAVSTHPMRTAALVRNRRSSDANPVGKVRARLPQQRLEVLS